MEVLHAASTDNLVLMIIDKRSDTPGNPWAIQIVQIPGPGLKVGTKHREEGGCWRLGLTDAQTLIRHELKYDNSLSH